MINYKPYKNRSIDFGKKVRVYRNLNARTDKPTYSIKQGGLVVGHAHRLMLSKCKFVVNPGGQKRSLASGHKNAHAFAEGFLVESGMGRAYDDDGPITSVVLSYALKHGAFVTRGTVYQKCLGAEIAVLNEWGLSVAAGIYRAL